MKNSSDLSAVLLRSGQLLLSLTGRVHISVHTLICKGCHISVLIHVASTPLLNDIPLTLEVN